MKIRIITYGRCRSLLQPAAADYATRIKKLVPTEIIELDEKKRGTSTSLARLVTDKDYVIALDATGKTYTSLTFAARLERLLVEAERITFIIGGAEGLPLAAQQLVKEKLSLTPLTLQHDLARVVFLEQLYRAITIIRGEPYHK